MSKLASRPNATLVHNFMNKRECKEFLAYGRKHGLGEANSYKIGNKKGGKAATLNDLVDAIYNIVRTSKGVFLDVRKRHNKFSIDYMWRAEQITGIPMGNHELPFLQHYEPGNVFRAHYDQYQIDMSEPYPYLDNQRSSTLLAYLADTEEGGETEFMLAEPRPVIVKPRCGVAVIWSNCMLEDKETVDTRLPRAPMWDQGRCMAGAGPHGAIADRPEKQDEEHVQLPCCIARDYNSIHQSRSVEQGSEKWTMTIWMRQRFTEYGIDNAELMKRWVDENYRKH